MNLSVVFPEKFDEPANNLWS